MRPATADTRPPSWGRALHSTAEDTNLQLRRAFRVLTDLDPSYWSFEDIKFNENPQAYFQYPAMMVPRMQGDIVDSITRSCPGVAQTFDPFAGSGTVLVESLKRGLGSLAIDINPMALLLCQVKSNGFRIDDARGSFQSVLKGMEKDESSVVEISYCNATKWFTCEALQELSRLKRAILCIEDREMRKLLWVAFAEAARMSSNSRTSTYKLHIRDAEDIKRRAEGVAQRVRASLDRVLAMYEKNYETLTEKGMLKNGKFQAGAEVLNHDMREALQGRKADALISSPPYGDNHTTITYGQHAFLPLCWIPLAEIDDSLAANLVTNTHAIDSASLGGKKSRGTGKGEEMMELSDSLRVLLESKELSREAGARLVAFFYDLDVSLGNALQVLKPGSPIVLTLGNRCVHGHRIPTDQITTELLQQRGCEYVDSHPRLIPTKRMAHRNKSAGTMLTETLLILRSPA